MSNSSACNEQENHQINRYCESSFQILQLFKKRIAHHRMVQHGNINQFEYPNPISMWPLYIFKKYCQVSRHMIQPIATLHPSIRYRTVTEADPDLRQRHSLSNPLANQNHVFYQIIDYSYYSISFYT